jgi:hypothetical protein
MSDHLRLAALAGTLFVTSYTSVTWVMAGAPVISVAPQRDPVQVAALSPAPRAAQPAPAPRIAPPAAQPAPPPQAAQPALPAGDGDALRDPLRLAALEASTAYAGKPCDAAAKAAMVEAVTRYAKAWADMMGCGPDGCDYRKINATAAVFSTPLDLRLRDAIGTAFDQRGIAIDDFPAQLRINVAMLVRGRGAPATACPETQAQAPR